MVKEVNLSLERRNTSELVQKWELFADEYRQIKNSLEATFQEVL